MSTELKLSNLPSVGYEVIWNLGKTSTFVQINDKKYFVRGEISDSQRRKIKEILDRILQDRVTLIEDSYTDLLFRNSMQINKTFCFPNGKQFVNLLRGVERKDLSIGKPD